MRWRKRALDVALSVIGLLLMWPLLAAIAVMVKGDGGPVFFRQQRVGRGGRLFRIWKFRTMLVGAERIGPQITAAGDHRITRVGAWLRRTKLDELPQLFNVLVGEMSLVGPRPEVPRYVALYDADQARVLELTPGITDVSSLQYFDESQILADSPLDPETVYVRDIMPAKIRADLAYAHYASEMDDLQVMARTAARIFAPRPPAAAALTPASHSRGKAR